MAAKKVGVLVKEARTAAGMTQEKLAKAAGENLTAAMIGKCERGEDDLTNAQLKKIASVCGVTQASLLNAPKNLSAAAKKKLDAAKKEAAAKTTAKTPAAKTASKAKTNSGSKTASTAKKTTAKKTASAGSVSPDGVATTTAKAKTTAKTTAKPAAASSEKLTAAEKTLLETYRGATATLKKAALKLLQGEYGKDPEKAMKGSSTSSAVQDGISDVLGDVLSGLFNK